MGRSKSNLLLEMERSYCNSWPTPENAFLGAGDGVSTIFRRGAITCPKKYIFRGMGGWRRHSPLEITTIFKGGCFHMISDKDKLYIPKL